MAATGGSPAWPLVAREAEVARIVGLAQAGDVPGVVLGGPSGVGKSRVAREAYEALVEAGAHGVWVQATTSAASVALGALAVLLPEDVHSDDTLSMLRGSAELLREQAGGRRVVVGVDDAHLLDPTSAALVMHLVVTGTAFVLATVRSGAPAPDAIVSLWKDIGAERLDLRPLDAHETEALLERVLGGPVEHGASGRVFDVTAGNVLFLRELVTAGVASGTLARDDGLWRLERAPMLARSLAEVIGDRLAALDGDDLRALELLALGEPMALLDLAELAGGDAVSRIEALDLIVVGAGMEVRLAHPLYGELVRDGIPRVRARAHAMRLVALTETRGLNGPDDALRVARWRRDAGEPVPRPTLLLAARAANLSGDSDLGAELAQAAMDLQADVEAATVLANAHTSRNRFDAAEAVLASVEGRSDDAEQARAYLEHRIWVQTWGLRQWDRVGELLGRAETWLPDDPTWPERLAAFSASVGSMGQPFWFPDDMHDDGPVGAGHLQRARRLEERLADADLPADRRYPLEVYLAFNLFFGGRVLDALAVSRRTLPDVPLRDVIGEIAMGTYVAMELEAGDDWPALRAWAEQTLPAAVRAGDHAAAGLACWALGHLALLQGRFTDAARWLPEAELHLQHRDALGQRLVVVAARVGLAALTGHADEAAERLRRMRDAAVRRAPLATQLFRLALGESRAAQAAGRLDEARRILLDAARQLDAMPVLAARLTYEAVRDGAAPGPAARAMADYARRCDGPLTGASARHVLALAADDPDALLAAADDLGRLGAHFHAMEACVQAATVLAAAGREDAARRAAERARAFHARTNGSPPPQVEGLDRRATGLTRREAELVELAAQGLSNAEIAERLVVSVRTVESHLYRAMHKLGVSDRRELRREPA